MANATIPPPPPNYSRGDQISYYAAKIDALEPGQGFGAAYTKWAESHPGQTAATAVETWLLEGTTKAVAATIQAAINAEAKGAGKLITTTTQSLSPLAGIAGFLGALGEANTGLRISEVLLGLILIGIGVARITGTQNVVSQVVKARIP